MASCLDSRALIPPPWDLDGDLDDRPLSSVHSRWVWADVAVSRASGRGDRQTLIF